MKIRTALIVSAILLLLAGNVSGEAELTIQRTFKTPDVPLDTAVTRDGRRLFILSAGGRLSVYSSRGRLEGILTVDKEVDKVRPGPRGDILFLINSRAKTVQLATLSFVQQISTQGSPSMGPEGAPVVIAVFSDFQ